MNRATRALLTVPLVAALRPGRTGPGHRRDHSLDPDLQRHRHRTVGRGRCRVRGGQPRHRHRARATWDRPAQGCAARGGRHGRRAGHLLHVGWPGPRRRVRQPGHQRSARRRLRREGLERPLPGLGADQDAVQRRDARGALHEPRHGRALPQGPLRAGRHHRGAADLRGAGGSHGRPGRGRHHPVRVRWQHQLAHHAPGRQPAGGLLRRRDARRPEVPRSELG